jgi:hypothetical protein
MSPVGPVSFVAAAPNACAARPTCSIRSPSANEGYGVGGREEARGTLIHRSDYSSRKPQARYSHRRCPYASAPTAVPQFECTYGGQDRVLTWLLREYRLVSDHSGEPDETVCKTVGFRSPP